MRYEYVLDYVLQFDTKSKGNFEKTVTGKNSIMQAVLTELNADGDSCTVSTPFLGNILQIDLLDNILQISQQTDDFHRYRDLFDRFYCQDRRVQDSKWNSFRKSI